MNIQEELRISMYQPIVGCAGTDEGKVFQYWLQKYGYSEIPYVFSLV